MGAFIAIYFLIILIFVGGAITLAVLYYKNLQDTLKEVAPHNQQIPPVNVWLMFIPLFNIIYPFIMYPKISESLRLEFEERGQGQPGDYGRSLGITMPILGLCGIIPILGYIAAIGNLIIWIIYWVKMAEFKKQLRALPKSADGGIKFSTSNDLLD